MQLEGQKGNRYRVLKRQAERLEARLVHLDASDNHFVRLRLVVLLAGGGLTFAAAFFGPPAAGWLVGLVSAVIFSIIVYFHRRLDRVRLRFRLAREWTSVQMARISLDWERIPAPQSVAPGDLVNANGRSPLPEISAHPFAGDLSLTGPRSLHHLLDTAVSQGGSLRLASWLLEPLPDPTTIRERQDILKEMSSLNGFRRHLALQGALAQGESKRWDGEKLLDWLEKQPRLPSLGRYLLLLSGLAFLNITLFGLDLAGLLPPLWVFSLILYGLIYGFRPQEIGETFAEAQFLSTALDKFRHVLVFLETYPYQGRERLARVSEPFWKPDHPPSRYLKSIVRVASAAAIQNNPIIAIFLNLVVPWDFYFAYRLSQYKVEIQDHLPVWLDAWYELEALNSLGNFAYLNPDYVYPQLRSAQHDPQTPVLSAADLGHPLIPEPVKVTNDFQMPRFGEVVIVTGSNMSGKSTFLRTLGINLCLAFVGGPVNASRFETVPFRIFTSIQVSDSLSDGISYFYAEVKRLRTLLDELHREHPFPLFFLIDEIFRGTNNREREIGSRAYVRALVGAHGSGLISTHDLELIHLAEDIPGIRNFHFREDVQDGRMIFDYRLRPGPSPTTNALKIMALEGLPVEAEPIRSSVR